MVSQNKKKLKKLLSERSLTVNRLDRFILYTSNIIKYGRVVMEYKEEETIRAFDKFKKI